MEVLRPAHQFMNNMNFQVVLFVIQSMLSWAMHVQVVYLVNVGSLAVKIPYLNVSVVASSQL